MLIKLVRLSMVGMVLLGECLHDLRLVEVVDIALNARRGVVT